MKNNLTLEYLLDSIIFDREWPTPKYEGETIKYLEDDIVKEYTDIIINELDEEYNEEVCFSKSETVILVGFATENDMHDVYAVGVASRVYRNLTTESGYKQY